MQQFTLCTNEWSFVFSCSNGSTILSHEIRHSHSAPNRRRETDFRTISFRFQFGHMAYSRDDREF